MQVLVCSFFISALVLVTFAQVPSYIKVCGRKNPQLNLCIPELNVPAIEYLEIEEGLPLANSNEIKASAKQVKLLGLPGFIINNIKMDLNAKSIDIDVSFKEVQLEGDYDVTAKIIVPVSGKGPIKIDAHDVTAKVSIHYRLVNTKKGQRMHFPSMTCKLRIASYHSKFIPNDSQDATFSEAINSVINNSQQEILDGIIPSLERSISRKILELANKVTKNFTYDELFPDRE
ncbi:GSCOCG00008204001-RA-CDS [Cotesia congregata]|nr:GSCOCG00008204001-RA-CDS [Cotesia congregata]